MKRYLVQVKPRDAHSQTWTTVYAQRVTEAVPDPLAREYANDIAGRFEGRNVDMDARVICIGSPR